MPYRAKLPLIALEFRGNHHAAVTIPVGKVLNVVGNGEDDGFLVGEVDRDSKYSRRTWKTAAPRTRRVAGEESRLIVEPKPQLDKKIRRGICASTGDYDEGCVLWLSRNECGGGRRDHVDKKLRFASHCSKTDGPN